MTQYVFDWVDVAKHNNDTFKALYGRIDVMPKMDDSYQWVWKPAKVAKVRFGRKRCKVFEVKA